MTLTDQNLREKDFHDKLQSKSKGRFENIFYKGIKSDRILNIIKDGSSMRSRSSYKESIVKKEKLIILDINFSITSSLSSFSKHTYAKIPSLIKECVLALIHIFADETR